jgi:hypothetical protein
MALSGEKDKKIDRSLFAKLLEFFKFEQTTKIPHWLKERKVSDNNSKSNAASKITKFAKEVNLTQSKLLEIYHIECEYEEKKYELLEQLPHLPQIMKKEISELRSSKMAKMQSALTKSQFAIYSKLFRKNKQHY